MLPRADYTLFWLLQAFKPRPHCPSCFQVLPTNSKGLATRSDEVPRNCILGETQNSGITVSLMNTATPA